MMNHGEKKTPKQSETNLFVSNRGISGKSMELLHSARQITTRQTQHMQPSSLTHSVRPIRCTMQVAAEWIDLRQPGSGERKKKQEKTLKEEGELTPEPPPRHRQKKNTPGLGL